MKIWIVFGNEFYEKFITEKMYFISTKLNAKGRTGMENAKAKLTLQPIGEFYYNNRFDVRLLIMLQNRLKNQILQGIRGNDC